MDPMRMKAIPSQAETNFDDPEEHFLWAFRNIPMLAGSGMLAHSGFFRKWSKHLWECGFAHRSWLERLADKDGNIHVSKLPQQKLFFQEAFRGPRHTYNPAARWVTEEELQTEPEPFVVPNIQEMTDQENWALAYQLKQRGFVIPDAVMPTQAEVIED